MFPPNLLDFLHPAEARRRQRVAWDSWRHYFKTVARGLIEEQINDAISGHGSNSEGRQYGIYEPRLMAAEIAKLPNPLQ